MFSKLLLTFSIASCVLHARAQSSAASAAPTIPTSAAQLSPCLATCTGNAASAAGCKSLTDVTCLCTSTAFQEAAAKCIMSTCTPADQQAAVGLQTALCSNSTASSGAPAGTGAPPASGTGAASAASGTATAKSPPVSAASGSGAPAASGTAPASAASGSPSAKASSGFRTVDLGTGHVVGLLGVLAAVMGGVGTFL